MSNPNDMIGAIASRSYSDSEGSQMRAFKEATEREKHSVSVQRLTESAEGRQVIERVRAAEADLARLLANAPAGTIPTQVRRQLEAIHNQLMI
jgi:hypothetical protein